MCKEKSGGRNFLNFLKKLNIKSFKVPFVEMVFSHFEFLERISFVRANNSECKKGSPPVNVISSSLSKHLEFNIFSRSFKEISNFGFCFHISQYLHLRLHLFVNEIFIFLITLFFLIFFKNCTTINSSETKRII